MQYSYKHYIIIMSGIMLSQAAYGMNMQPARTVTLKPIDIQGDGWRDQSMAPRVSALLAKRIAQQTEGHRTPNSCPTNAQEQLTRFSFTTHFLQLLDTHGQVNPFLRVSGCEDRELFEQIMLEWQCITDADKLVKLALKWQKTSPTNEMIAAWHARTEDTITGIDTTFKKANTPQAEIDRRVVEALSALAQVKGPIITNLKSWPKALVLQPKTREFLTAIRSEAESMLSFLNAAQKLVEASQTT